MLEIALIKNLIEVEYWKINYNTFVFSKKEPLNVLFNLKTKKKTETYNAVFNGFLTHSVMRKSLNQILNTMKKDHIFGCV